MSNESMGNEPVPKKKENETSNDANSKKECPEAPLTVAPAKPNFAQKGRDCCKKYKRIKEEIKYWFELGGILAGLAVLVVIIFQLSVMQSQTEVMQGQLKEMQAAKKLSTRAWVYPKIDNNSLIQEPTSFFIKPRVENAGTTPAVVTGSYANIATDANFIPKHDPLETNLSLTLNPGSSAYPNTPRVPPIALAANVPVYFYGTIYYSDIFGDRHWVQYCYLLKDGGASCLSMPFHDATDDTEDSEKKMIYIRVLKF